MRLTNFFCIAFFALLFAPFCLAVLVSVRPAGGAGLEVYSFEVTAFEAVAVNDTLDNIKPRKFKCTVFRPLVGYSSTELEKLESLLKNG